MTLFRGLIIGLLMLTCSAGAIAAEMVVIVCKENPLNELTQDQVIDLFMGREIHFPNGNPALPIDHPAKSTQRERFYFGLTGKSIGEINAYWARLLFTGNASPPHVLPDTASILKAVEQNPQAISYVDAELVNEHVKIVFHLHLKGLH